MEEELVRRAGVPFTAIEAAGLHGVGLKALPGNLARLSRGYRQARRLLQDFRPQAMFFTGGYVAAPLALAGRRIPTLVYTPDLEPGLALQFLARQARRIGVTVAEAASYYRPAERAKIVVTGYPTRADLTRWSRAEALATLELTPDVATVLVFGGSKGARSLNRALLAILPELLSEMQVIHLSGAADWDEVVARRGELPAAAQARYRAFPYLHAEMGAALAAADLVVSRAGASVLGEYPLFGLPAILVPYPYAWRYQHTNASYLERHGAAQILADADLPTALLPQVRNLIRAPERRAAMRQAMLGLAQPQAAARLAAELVSLAGAPAGRAA
jgi:UDP-N-acetylglucosamine--N-acetylmuramyl-(pentapeptide) pyrophosphoryl-undecaprenol N-acetylglucosamine transferase